MLQQNVTGSPASTEPSGAPPSIAHPMPDGAMLAPTGVLMPWMLVMQVPVAMLEGGVSWQAAKLADVPHAVPQAPPVVTPLHAEHERESVTLVNATKRCE